MKALRPAAAAAILTALLAVPAHADHKRFEGFAEPFFVPVPQLPLRGRWRNQDGYPVALVRQRLRGIGFSQIGQFDVYPGAYGVTAVDPGGVRVDLVIDRWSGDIVRARVADAGPALRPDRPPGLIDRVAGTSRKIAALHVPPLPRPAPGRMREMAGVTPSPEPEAPVEIAAEPKHPAIAEPDQGAEAAVLAPKPARPVTALQGERFDPADIRDPIAVY